MMRRWATLLLPLVLVSAAAGYTVDCDPERADCEKALSDLKQMTQKMISTVKTTDPVTKSTAAETSKTITEPTPAITQEALTTLDVFTNPNSTHDFNFAEWAHVFDDSSKENAPKPTVSSRIEPVKASKNESSFEQRARSLNLSLDELQTFANSIHGHSNASQNGRSRTSDLSDVSLDGDDSTTEFPMDIQMDEGRILNKPIRAGIYSSNVEDSFHPSFTFHNTDSDSMSCGEDGVKYRLGDKYRKGCEEQCECAENGPQCSPICQQPYFRKGRRLPDPLCSEKPVDDCCALLVCASDDSDRKMSGSASCKFGNTTYAVGSKWNVGCEEVCVCESNSMVNCTQRCPELPVREHCVNVPDPNDPCCQLQLCDVSQDVHEESIKDMMSDERHRMDTNLTVAEDRVGPAVNEITSFAGRESQPSPVHLEPINSVKVLTNNSVQINIFRANSSNNPIHLQVNRMGDNKWRDIMLTEYNLLLNMEPGEYKIKSLETGKLFNFTIPSKVFVPEVQSDGSGSARAGCSYNGKVYAKGEEYHKGCEELCECTGPEQSECNPIQCPSTVGLDVLEPTCVSWAPEPPDFQPIAPHCCPRTMRCLSNGSCQYEGHTISNWAEVPLAISGCERRCFCDTGVIDCQPNCAPLPALPPAHLRCPLGQHPALVESLVPGDDCCKQWGCIAKGMPSTRAWQEAAVRTLNHTNFHNITLHSNHIIESPVPTIFFKNITKPTPTIEYVSHPNDMLLVYPKATKNVSQNPTANHGAGSNAYTPKMYMNTDYKSYNYPGPFAEPLQLSDDKYNNEQQMFEMETVKEQKHRTENSNNQFNVPPADKVLTKLNLTNPMTTYRPTAQTPFYLKHYKAERKLTLNSTLPKVPLFTPLPYNLSDNPTIRKININRDRTRYELQKTLENFDPDSHYYSMYSALPLHSHRLNASGHRRHRDDKENLLNKDYLKHISLSPHPIQPNSNPAQYVPVDVQDLLKELQLYDLTRPLTHIKTGPNEYNVPRRTSTTEPNHPGLNWIQTNNNNIPLPPGFLPTIPPNDENPFIVNNNFDAMKNQFHGIPTESPMDDPQHILDILLKKKMLSVVTLESDSPTSVKMMFGLPPELVGMRGSVDLRYTDSDDKNVSNWESQVFAPADEILGTSRLEFRLPGLKPSTVYHIQAKLFLHGRSEQPVSSVYTVKTLDEPVVEEKRIQVDSGLSVTDLNATNALLSWRRFIQDELVYIDALQIRYRPVEQAIFSTTELLHASRMSVQLQSLKPNTQYEAALILVPPVGGQVELFDPRSVPFLTPPLIDIYDWLVEIETDEIGSNTASLKWKGIPSPPEKFVSVYRAVHDCEGSAVASDQDNHVFKLAVRDHKPTIFITGLQPGTRCRLWLELFLTNGNKTKSNVLDILTKPADSHQDIDNIVEASGVAATGRRSDYYGPLVVVAVLAALATMSALLLLLVLLRRHRPHSVPITTTVPSAPRALPSLPPYDNPSYKLELQQETMNL